MKKLDVYLQNYRVKIVSAVLPADINKIFDIGCSDGALLRGNRAPNRTLVGCDPKPASEIDGVSIIVGYFPDCILNNASVLNGSFDVVCALAVFEHFEENALLASSVVLKKMLKPDGLVIATVPSPLVDLILHLLIFLRVIDGQEAHQHHGFQPKDLIRIFEKDFRLLQHRKFQLGLNNLFVFESK